MKKIKFIYFDIGNVMANTNNYFKGVSEKFNIPLNEFKNYWLGDNGADDMTRGKITAQEFWQTAVVKFNLKGASDFDFLECWLDDFKPIYDVHRLAERLSSKYRIGLLSNLYPGMISRLIEKGLVAGIDYSTKVLSCEVGLRKPEKEIYKISTQKSGFLPDEILFIDDREDFIKGAKDFGWQTVWFNENDIAGVVSAIQELLL
jgi:putative hydrolase of the HAD superfamily